MSILPRIWPGSPPVSFAFAEMSARISPSVGSGCGLEKQRVKSKPAFYQLVPG